MTENQKIIDFLNELKSAAPAPGGGAVAALTGAQGAADYDGGEPHRGKEEI